MYSAQVPSDELLKQPILGGQRAVRSTPEHHSASSAIGAFGLKADAPTAPLLRRTVFSTGAAPLTDIRTHRRPLCAITRPDTTRNTPEFNPGRLRRDSPRRPLSTTPSFLDINADFCESVAFLTECDLKAVVPAKRIFAMSQKICRFSY